MHIVIFEDEPSIRDSFGLLADMRGHTVHMAASMEEASLVIDAMRRREIAADVAVVDGDLRSGNMPDPDNKDGRSIIQNIRAVDRELGHTTCIIAFSNRAGLGDLADINPGKDSVAVLNIIDEHAAQLWESA